MAVGWTDARARLAAQLLTVNITTPITQTIKRVYTNPPGSALDVPCFILYPAIRSIERYYGKRDKNYLVRCRLLVQDADIDQAAAICDSYREAALDVLDQDTTLNGTATEAFYESAAELSGFSYGGRDYVGLDVMVSIKLHEEVTFGA